MSYIGNPIISTDFPKDKFSGNGSTTAFTMSIAPASVNSVLVIVSGITQSTETYTISGTTLTFSAAPPAGTDNILVRHLGVAGTPQVPATGSVVPASMSTGAPYWDTSGNVGVGTTSPLAKLHVSGGQSYVTGASGSGAYSRWYNNAQTNNDFQVGQGWSSGSDNVAVLNNNANAAMIFGTNGSEQMRIDASGRVTTPAQPFFAGTHASEYGTTFTAGTTIPVSTSFTNTGNHFNTSTYTFTCPVSGVYEAMLTDLSQDPDTAALAVYINGSLTTKAYWQSTRQRFHAALFYASANDAITFRVGEGSCKLYGTGSYGRYQIRLIG